MMVEEFGEAVLIYTNFNYSGLIAIMKVFL